MSSFRDDPRLAALHAATATLTAPGAPFELRQESVRGEHMPMFANRARSLREILAGGGARGEQDCYVFGDGTRVTFADAARRAASVASALASRGIAPGDRVAICAANCPEWLDVFWATAAMNAVLVAMNGWWTATEMRNAIALTEPALLIVDEARFARLDEDPGVPLLVIEREFATLLESLDAPMPDAAIDEDDPFMLIFTSGTTGRPKAAVLSHRSVIGYLSLQSFFGARAVVMSGRAPGAPPTRLAPYPLFHVSGVSATVSTMLGGGTTVWPLGRFDPEAVIELTKREGIAVWNGAVPHVMRLLDSPAIETLDPMQMVSVGVGGSVTTPATVRRIEERFPHLERTVSTGYGSTETGGLVSLAPGWMLADANDCVGPPAPIVELRITNEHGAVLAEGEEGNIEARSPIVMLGYWRNDEANAEAMLPGLWVRTGDFGRLEDGLLFVASRRRDLIIRGGENIYPFEIENRLDEHPDVVEAAVIGVEHRTLGQEVKAVVVVRVDAVPSIDDLRAWCAATLASYKVPAHVELRTAPLPRNATGKVMKHVLVDDDANVFVED